VFSDLKPYLVIPYSTYQRAEKDEILQRLRRIQAYKKAGCDTWKDHMDEVDLRRRLVDLELARAD
jgi:hypothetical protein